MRLIDADALLSDIERTIVESGCVNHDGEIMDCVRYASEVDVVPVVRGEWVEARHGVMSVWPEGQVMCSVCGQRMPCQWQNRPPYCYGCGAKMEDKPCG